MKSTAQTEKPSGHTPGPWRLDSDSGIIFTVLENQDEPAIALTRPCDNPQWTINDEVAEANARLIAAAPELLEALRKVQAFINDLSKSNPGFLGNLVLQDYAQYNEAMLAMPRAIAKAEGK